MHFTLRQQRRLIFLTALWTLITAFCALAGPFGTHGAMDLPMRGAYWGGIVALSLVGSELIARLPVSRVPVQLAFWVVYALGLTGVVLGLNSLLFSAAHSNKNVPYLFATIAVTVVLIHAVVFVIRTTLLPQGQTDAQGVPDAEATFLRRLPLEVRGALVRIEAQDHYLNVVTQNGRALVLLRLADAVAELAQVSGLHVHRSHWVKLDAVTAHRRRAGRDTLVMSDGAEIPVARGKRAAAKAAGLF